MYQPSIFDELNEPSKAALGTKADNLAYRARDEVWGLINAGEYTLALFLASHLVEMCRREVTLLNTKDSKRFLPIALAIQARAAQNCKNFDLAIKCNWEAINLRSRAILKSEAALNPRDCGEILLVQATAELYFALVAKVKYEEAAASFTQTREAKRKARDAEECLERFRSVSSTWGPRLGSGSAEEIRQVAQEIEELTNDPPPI